VKSKHGTAQVEIVSNDIGNRITPSWVAFTADGETLIGDAAKNQVGENPTNTLYDVRFQPPSSERFEHDSVQRAACA
jgi:molecular chaperone DnaK (HSP70)